MFPLGNLKSSFECIFVWSFVSNICFDRSLDQESYGIEFVFDADVKCAVAVHYMATEDLSTGLAM